VAGVGIADATAGVRSLAARVHPRSHSLPRLAAGAAALIASGAFAFGAIPNARLLPGDARSIDHVADMDSSLVHTIDEAGGAGAILRCGPPTTTWYAVTALAYDLQVGAARVQDRPRGRRPVVVQPVHETWQIRPRHCPSSS
jgi:hypothetical protein